jgi:hypothetical protein
VSRTGCSGELNRGPGGGQCPRAEVRLGDSFTGMIGVARTEYDPVRAFYCRGGKEGVWATSDALVIGVVMAGATWHVHYEVFSLSLLNV